MYRWDRDGNQPSDIQVSGLYSMFPAEKADCSSFDIATPHSEQDPCSVCNNATGKGIAWL